MQNPAPRIFDYQSGAPKARMKISPARSEAKCQECRRIPISPEQGRLKADIQPGPAQSIFVKRFAAATKIVNRYVGAREYI
jgi:hypothetical protein